MPPPQTALPGAATPAPPPLPYPSALARDNARAGVPDLAGVQTVWAALHAIECAALPLAAEELAHVAAANAQMASQADVSTNTASTNEDDDEHDVLSPFLSSAVPAITFPRYALHVAEATGYGHAGLAVGLGLLGRYAVVSGRGVTPLSMHRLFATCMQLGMKTASDDFVKNVYVAPLVGMTPTELNVLECALAVDLDFRCLVTPDEVTRLPSALAELLSQETAAAAAAAATMDDVQSVFVDTCSVAPPPPEVETVPRDHPLPDWTPAGGLVELYTGGGHGGTQGRGSSGGTEGGNAGDEVPSSAGGGVPQTASERGASGYGSMVHGPMSVSVLPTSTNTAAAVPPPAAAGSPAAL